MLRLPKVNIGRQREERGQCTKALNSRPNAWVFSSRCLDNYHTSFNKRRTWLSVNLIIIVKLFGEAEREERKEGGAIGWRRDDNGPKKVERHGWILGHRL